MRMQESAGSEQGPPDERVYRTPGSDRFESEERSTSHEDCPLAYVKARLSADLDECGVEGPVIITRNGKAVAVLLVPYDDDDLERLLLGRSPRFQALLNRSRQSIEEGKGLSENA